MTKHTKTNRGDTTTTSITPLSKIIEEHSLDHDKIDKDINDFSLFESWLNTRFKEMTKLKVDLLLADTLDDEMIQWATNHASVLGEVLTQLKFVKKQQGLKLLRKVNEAAINRIV